MNDINWKFVIAVLVAFLAGVFAAKLKEPKAGRFVHEPATNPYVVLDTQKGQMCWAGPVVLAEENPSETINTCLTAASDRRPP